MKHLKKILSIIFIFAIFIGSFVGSYYLLRKGTYDIDSENLAVFDENLSRFYLQKADRKIIFRVRCDEGTSFSYTLVDSNENVVSTTTQKAPNNCYDILPPSGGYVAGERYTLILPEGISFESEDLRDARSLVFSIEKEDVEYYEFTDAVVEADAVIGEVVNDTLNVENLNVSGDSCFDSYDLFTLRR